MQLLVGTASWNCMCQDVQIQSGEKYNAHEHFYLLNTENPVAQLRTTLVYWFEVVPIFHCKVYVSEEVRSICCHSVRSFAQCELTSLT